MRRSMRGARAGAALALVTGVLVQFVAPSAQATTNLITNGSFEVVGAGWLNPWSFNVSKGAAGDISQAAAALDGSHSAQVAVTKASSSAAAIQLSQRLALAAGVAYTASFSARAASSRTLDIAIQQTSAPHKLYAFERVTLSTTWQTFMLGYTATTSNDYSLAFNLAASTTTLNLDAVSMTPATSTPTATPAPDAGPTGMPGATPTPMATSSPTPTPDPGSTTGSTPTPTAAVTPAPPPTPSPAPTASPFTTPSVSPTPGPTQAPSGTPAGGFVSRSGTRLTLAGEPFRFTGFNIYQANSVSNCSYTMGTGPALDTALTDIGSGATVFRTWFFQYLATTNGQRDWTAFDHTIAVAKAHGVRIIATLGNQWGSCESKTSYYKWDSWYTGGYRTQILPGTIDPYYQWVQEVVSRYRNEPTIAMWQLMNEAEVKIDNTSTCAPASDLYTWTVDVSAMVKAIDPNHLVSLGTMGGGQCGTQGSQYGYVNSVPTVDVCEFHDYGHPTTALPASLASDVAACDAVGKPIFTGEAGIKITDVPGGTLQDRANAFSAKIAAQFGAGASGFLVWSWNNTPASGSYEVGPGDPTVAVVDQFGVGP